MKYLLALGLLLFAPLSAFPGAAFAPPPARSNCKFSPVTREHSEIAYKDKRVCAQKLCYHAVKCQNNVFTVTCPAKNGQCDGYSADECVGKATNIEND